MKFFFLTLCCSINTLIKALMFFIGCYCGFICNALCAQDTAELENKIRDARLAITSAELKVSYTTKLDLTSQVAPGEHVPVSGSFVIIFRSPSDFRVDAAHDIKIDGKLVKSRPAKRVLTDDEWISLTSFNKGASIAVDGVESAPSGLVSAIVDPRVVGLCATSYETWGNYGLEDAVFLSNRGSATVISETIEEIPTKLLEGNYTIGKTQISHRTWIATEMGFSILARELEDDHVRQRIEVANKKHNGEIWFPETVRVSEYHDGDLVFDQIVKVEHAEFNQDIEDEAFSLSALGIEKGAQLVVHGQHMIWDGEEAIPDPSVARTFQKETLASSDSGTMLSWRIVLLTGNGVVCAVIAYAIWLKRKNTT